MKPETRANYCAGAGAGAGAGSAGAASVGAGAGSAGAGAFSAGAVAFGAGAAWSAGGAGAIASGAGAAGSVVAGVGSVVAGVGSVVARSCDRTGRVIRTRPENIERDHGQHDDDGADQKAVAASARDSATIVDDRIAASGFGHQRIRTETRDRCRRRIEGILSDDRIWIIFTCGVCHVVLHRWQRLALQ